MSTISEIELDECEELCGPRKKFQEAYECLEESTKKTIQNEIEKIKKSFAKIEKLTHPTSSREQMFLNHQLSALQLYAEEIRKNKTSPEDAYEYLKYLIPNLTIREVKSLSNISINMNGNNNGVATLLAKKYKTKATKIYYKLKNVERYDNLEIVPFFNGESLFREEEPHEEIMSYFFKTSRN